MVIAAVLVVNAFHGISTSAWTGWVWFAVTIGVILIWIYTVSYLNPSCGTLSKLIYSAGRLLRHTTFCLRSAGLVRLFMPHCKYQTPLLTRLRLQWERSLPVPFSILLVRHLLNLLHRHAPSICGQGIPGITHTERYRHSPYRS